MGSFLYSVLTECTTNIFVIWCLTRLTLIWDINEAKVWQHKLSVWSSLDCTANNICYEKLTLSLIRNAACDLNWQLSVSSRRVLTKGDYEELKVHMDGACCQVGTDYAGTWRKSMSLPTA